MRRILSVILIVLMLSFLSSCAVSGSNVESSVSTIGSLQSMAESIQNDDVRKSVSTNSTSSFEEATDTASETLATKISVTSRTTSSSSAYSVSSTMTVHFLDVNQGAATLLQIGNKTMIVDGGDRDKSSFVVAYLKKLGISQVDVMIATHYDADHINGLVGVLNTFPVKQVYDANYATDTRVFNSFKNYIKDNNIPEAIPGIRQAITVGDARVTFIAPRQYGHKEGNDDSICIKVQFGETSFVIMGDPSADAEQQILTQDLSADVLYASHHGSNGSNSKTLLANVSPEYVVISCGEDNSYGHPGDNTLARIKNVGAELFRTDKQGTIIATSDGKSITWNQDPCNDFTPGTEPTTAATTTTATTKSTTIVATTIPPATGGASQAYVLNTNTIKFHYPSCRYVSSIDPSNRQDVNMTRDEILANGFIPCKVCGP